MSSAGSTSGLAADGLGFSKASSAAGVGGCSREGMTARAVVRLHPSSALFILAPLSSMNTLKINKALLSKILLLIWHVTRL